MLSTTIPPEGYAPGETYTITLDVAEAGRPRFGFGALPFAADLNDGAGTVILTDTDRTQAETLGNRTYVTHTIDGAANADANNWSFDWTAPDAGTGAVTSTPLS